MKQSWVCPWLSGQWWKRTGNSLSWDYKGFRWTSSFLLRVFWPRRQSRSSAFQAAQPMAQEDFFYFYFYIWHMWVLVPTQGWGYPCVEYCESWKTGLAGGSLKGLVTKYQFDGTGTSESAYVRKMDFFNCSRICNVRAMLIRLFGKIACISFPLDFATSLWNSLFEYITHYRRTAQRKKRTVAKRWWSLFDQSLCHFLM